MQDYKLSFNKIYLFISLLICAHEVHGRSLFNKEIYSLTLKENILFEKVLKESNYRILVIDEFCSVCEVVLKELKDVGLEDYILATIRNPSFKWLAKKKRQGVKNSIYNIASLNFDLSEGTPQLLEFNRNGELIKKVYGKTKIFEIIRINKRK